MSATLLETLRQLVPEADTIMELLYNPAQAPSPASSLPLPDISSQSEQPLAKALLLSVETRVAIYCSIALVMLITYIVTRLSIWDKYFLEDDAGESQQDTTAFADVPRRPNPIYVSAEPSGAVPRRPNPIYVSAEPSGTEDTKSVRRRLPTNEPIYERIASVHDDNGTAPFYASARRAVPVPTPDDIVREEDGYEPEMYNGGRMNGEAYANIQVQISPDDIFQSATTMTYYPALSHGLARTGSCDASSDEVSLRRRTERDEIDSEEDSMLLKYTFVSFIIELLPGPLAIIFGWSAYGLNFVKSRLFWPYAPKYDTAIYVMIAGVVLYFGDIPNKQTGWITMFAVVGILLCKSIVITFKYITLGDSENEGTVYGSCSQYFHKTRRVFNTILWNFVHDLFGTQRLMLLEQLYNGTIFHEINPALVILTMSPSDAKAIWSLVKWHGEKMRISDSDSRFPGKPQGWGRYLEHKFFPFGYDLFFETAGHSDADIEAMCEKGQLPASILSMYIVFTTYKRRCKKEMLQVKIYALVTGVIVALGPFFLRFLSGKSVLGETVEHALLHIILGHIFLLSTIFMVAISFSPMTEMENRRRMASALTSLIHRGLEIEEVPCNENSFSTTWLWHDCDCQNCTPKASGAKDSALLLNLAIPKNVAGWDAIRRLLHGPNFARGFYRRGQFYMCVTFALEVGFTIAMDIYQKHTGWDPLEHLEVTFPSFCGIAMISTCIVTQILIANAINNEAEAQAMALLKAKTCWVQQQSRNRMVADAVALIETVHKAVEVDVIGNPVCVMYLEANYGTIGAIFTILASAFYNQIETLLIFLIIPPE